MQINITAIVKSKPEKFSETSELLTDMAINSKKETACLQYHLHQDKKNPNVFVFHEIWEDEKGLAFHEQQSYIQNFREKTSIWIESVSVYKTTKIV